MFFISAATLHRSRHTELETNKTSEGVSPLKEQLVDVREGQPKGGDWGQEKR